MRRSLLEIGARSAHPTASNLSRPCKFWAEVAVPDRTRLVQVRYIIRHHPAVHQRDPDAHTVGADPCQVATDTPVARNSQRGWTKEDASCFIQLHTKGASRLKWI